MPQFAINPGDMRTSITLQSPTTAKGGGGAQVSTYANVTTHPVVKAKWVNAHGQEAVSSDALKSIQRATVTIRHRDDINSTWRILKNGEAWEIKSIDLVQDRNRWIEIIVERAKATV